MFTVPILDNDSFALKRSQSNSKLNAVIYIDKKLGL